MTDQTGGNKVLNVDNVTDYFEWKNLKCRKITFT